VAIDAGVTGTVGVVALPNDETTRSHCFFSLVECATKLLQNAEMVKHPIVTDV